MVASSEEVILRVASATPVHDLGSAIAHAIYDNPYVIMRAIGNGAIGQGMKAVAVARGYVAPRGIDLVVIPGFVDITTPDRGEVTGMTLKVVAR